MVSSLSGKNRAIHGSPPSLGRRGRMTTHVMKYKMAPVVSVKIIDPTVRSFPFKFKKNDRLIKREENHPLTARIMFKSCHQTPTQTLTDIQTPTQIQSHVASVEERFKISHFSTFCITRNVALITMSVAASVHSHKQWDEWKI